MARISFSTVTTVSAMTGSRARRLPSEVWTQHEATKQLDGHLRTVHEHYGEQLRQLYRHRPMGERVILGFAAASGVNSRRRKLRRPRPVTKGATRR